MTVLPSPVPHPLDHFPAPVPPWAYDALEWVVGFDWPEGDEAATRELADRWYGLASALAGPHDAAFAAASRIISGYVGEGVPAEGFLDAWERLAGDDAAPLNALPQITQEVGGLVEESARQLEAAKLEALIELGVFLTELHGLAVVNRLAGGTAGAAAGRLVARTGYRIRQIFQRLLASWASPAGPSSAPATPTPTSIPAQAMADEEATRVIRPPRGRTPEGDTDRDDVTRRLYPSTTTRPLSLEALVGASPAARPVTSTDSADPAAPETRPSLPETVPPAPVNRPSVPEGRPEPAGEATRRISAAQVEHLADVRRRFDVLRREEILAHLTATADEIRAKLDHLGGPVPRVEGRPDPRRPDPGSDRRSINPRPEKRPDLHGTEPSGTEPSGTEPSGTEPSGTEPSGTEPGGTEPRGVDSRSIEPRSADPRAAAHPRSTTGAHDPGALAGGRETLTELLADVEKQIALLRSAEPAVAVDPPSWARTTAADPAGTHGDLRSPAAGLEQALAEAVPHGADGRPRRRADPRSGRWFTMLNGGGPASEPTRGLNPLEAVLALLDTYVHGRPRVAAARSFDGYAHGDPNRAIGGEWTGLDRVQQAAGTDLQNLCPFVGNADPAEARSAVDAAMRNLANHLHNTGYGAFAVIVTDLEGGGCHAWAALNQDSTVLFLDPQVGRIAEAPLYRHHGVPSAANVVSMDALVVDGRGDPAPLPFHGPGQWSSEWSSQGSSPTSSQVSSHGSAQGSGRPTD